MLHDIQMCFHRFSVNVPCVRMLCGVALLLLLHTKEVGLGGGSEPRRPISLQLPGLHRRWLADALSFTKRKKKNFSYKMEKIKTIDWFKCDDLFLFFTPI